MRKNLTFGHAALLFSLYTTQYLGFAFFTEAFTGILRQNGVSLENLGFIHMLGLFWVFRFLWAPFVDSISFGKLGHYRAWIIIFQSFMVVILVLTSMFNLLDNISTVVILSIFFVFFSASQDIALDALVFKTVSLKHRPNANAIKSACSMMGMVLGSGVGLILYVYIGWEYTTLILAFATAVSLIQILLYKEPIQENDNVKAKIDFKQYIYFWKTKRRKHWLLFLIIYPISTSSAFGLITPMLVDLKWELDRIGFFVHIIGYSVGIFASFGASWFILKYSKRYMLIISAIGQVVGILLLLPLSYGYHTSTMVTITIGVIFFFYTPSLVVMNTLMMDESSEKTPATQFAIQNSIFKFAAIFSSGMAISLSGIFGYSNIIIAGAIIGLLAIYASFKIKLLSI